MLRAAVVDQAVKDYRSARKKLCKEVLEDEERYQAEKDINEVERFFLSKRSEMWLDKENGERIVILLRKENYMNKKLLKSKMVAFGDNNYTLSAALGIAPQTFSNKINETNGAEFTQGEMNLIRRRYKLTNEEFMKIFFADVVS